MAGALLFASGSGYAAPVYIGLQIAGYDGGAGVGQVEQEATGNGSASITNLAFGNVSTAIFQTSVTVTGTPPNPEPNLFSTDATITGSHPGTMSIYVTETNQFASGFKQFESDFGVASNPFPTNAQVVESTYVHECASPGNACTAADIFQTTTLLSTTTFTANGAVTNDVQAPALPTLPFAVTEVYTITLTAADYTDPVSASIRLYAVPEPASLGFFSLGLMCLGAIRRRFV